MSKHDDSRLAAVLQDATYQELVGLLDKAREEMPWPQAVAALAAFAVELETWALRRRETQEKAFEQRPAQILSGIYQHFKGGRYRVHGVVARNTQTGEDLVVYEALYKTDGQKWWARPLEEFLSEVEVDGVLQPRFKWVASASAATAPDTSLLPKDVKSPS